MSTRWIGTCRADTDRRFRKAGYAAIDQICDYYSTLHERPVKATVEPGYLLEQLPRMSSPVQAGVIALH